jgi:hypothetical protein
LFALAACLSTSALGAVDIAGTVHNQTTSKPSTGDDVILLRLGNGMEEEARTKTDAHGGFTLTASVAGAQYVVRVMHQGVNYDYQVNSAATVEIRVFDAVRKIEGLSGSIGMVQLESDRTTLKVIEMYGITNASNPPVTQSGPRNFEVSLPAGATLDSIEAKRAEGVWTNTLPTAIPGQARGYAINFPIRPGDTLFKATYHLPYSGPTRFRLRLPYPIQKFAVIHPPSMSFRPLQQGVFMTPGQANGLQIEKAVREPSVGAIPAFEISGIGSAPSPAVATRTPAPTPTGSSLRAAGGIAAKTGESEDKNIVLWLSLLAGTGFLGAGIWFALRKRRGQIQPAQRRRPLVEVLKEELFQLEVDRARGSISAEEYTATKQALNHTLQRALTKAGAGS